MALDQLLEPVGDFFMESVTVMEPSPPLKVPDVLVSVSPTTGEPVSVGLWTFLLLQARVLVQDLVQDLGLYPAH